MASRGFEYVPFFPWKEDVDPNEEIFQSLSRQRRHAYNVAWGGREKSSVAYYSKDGRLLSERNTDACLVIAFNRTRGGPYLTIRRALDRWFTAYQEMQEEITADPRLVAGLVIWAGCMKNSGYQVSDPNDLDYDDGEQRVADTTCRDETHLDRTLHEVEVRHETRWAEQYRKVYMLSFLGERWREWARKYDRLTE